jgi:hypothetical protein
MTVSSCSPADGEWEEKVRVNEMDTNTRAELIEYTVEVSTAGTLGNLIESNGYTDAQSLIVTGSINRDDISYVDTNLPSVEKLDLSGAEYYLDYIRANFLSSNTCIKEISLPYNLTVIKNGEGGYGGGDLGAFSNCASLEKVIIPEGVTTIEFETFDGCSSLTEIVIPESVTTIEYATFYKCSSLTHIDLPKGLTRISNQTFYGCSFLAEIEIPEGITSIGSSAFSGCTSLSKVTIPNSVTNIDYSAFEGCSSLAEIFLPENLKAIGDHAFAYCESITEITIPESVRDIGERAFYCCYNLTDITILEGVTNIGYEAFRACNPTELIVPSSVEDTGNSFIAEGCTNLQKVIWNSPAYIDDLSNTNDLYCWLIIHTQDGQVPIYGPNWKNIVIDGVAVNVELPFQYKREFSIPKEVKSIQKISYTMTFDKNYDISNFGVWKTIALPFTPTLISHPEKGTLAPFDSEEEATHHFWLKELTEEGYKDVTALSPNLPYIIAMPYSSSYGDEYNISGDVTFSAENITLDETADFSPASTQGTDYTMYASYAYTEPTDGIYVLNNGSEFVNNYMSLYPFQSYIQPNTRSMRSVIPMTSGRVATRAIADEKRKPQKEDM